MHQLNGSAAYYSTWNPFRKSWAPAYPETTGYLIETLLDYNSEYPWTADYAEKCADWLLGVQMPSGAFPSLYATSGKPKLIQFRDDPFWPVKGVQTF